MRTVWNVKADYLTMASARSMQRAQRSQWQASTSHPFAHELQRMTSVFGRRRSSAPIVEGGRPTQ